MKKIRIQNIKTGKVSEVTEIAWRVIKRGNQGKFFDIIEKPETKITFNAPPQPAAPKHVVIESPSIPDEIQNATPVEIQAENAPEPVESIQETPIPDVTSTPVKKAAKKGRKPKK